jgi:[glutamine synthetase] adenylyltransferase / [glutamine synthetase]-adenylyl-L-tyrosine phosphorylase
VLDLDRFRHSPDPAGARNLLERLGAAGLTEELLEAAGPDANEVLRIACTQVPYVGTLALRDPSRLTGAASDPFLRREKPAERMAAELASLGPVTPATLRELRHREYIRLGARECSLGDPAEVGRELAHLADVCLDAAVAVYDEELARLHGEPRYLADDGTTRRARLVVFGMGKHGGEELNFASDVDLIYVYSSDNGSAGELSLHEYFERLARRVTRAIGDPTEDGHVFRVDLRLRPEGTKGPLVNSLLSLERYYETWGRPWERQAWIKARAVAGSQELGDEVLAMLAPFIYPRTTSYDVLGDIAELNRKIKAELDMHGVGRPGASRRVEDGYDVKLGVGGIREIEFFVQALQLLHGGKDPTLRERSTRRALDRLFFAGLVADRERRALHDAYDFLRQVEHRIQLQDGRQTHRLPTDIAALEVLARRLGFAGAGELAGTLALRTGEVASIFATLGDEHPARPEVAVLLDRTRPAAEHHAALAALGFRDVDSSLFQIGLLAGKPASPLGAAATGAAARVAPALLEELAASPDPDQALRYTVDLVSQAGSWHGIWKLLDENRPLLRLLASLFGTSAFMARAFVGRPELLDAVLAGRGAQRTPDELAAVVRDSVAGLDEETALNRLRRVKTEEVVRIGLGDIDGRLDLDEVIAELSVLADACVERTYSVVHGALARRKTIPPLVVVGLGKLGGREMDYASDLDIVFVYDDAADVDGEVATRLAQRLVHALGAHLDEGRLYEVDTRLRPSGQQGTLVSSLSAWRQYHARAARLWERQALIKCRAVAGDPALGRTVEEEAQRFVYQGGGEPAAVAAEIAAMRARIERELAAPGGFDIKTGPGGLIDVEFAAQLLQLVHGERHPTLRVRATLPALDAARAAGLIDEDDHRTLTSGYRFLRRLENRLRIVHDRPVHELPWDAAGLEMLARRAHFPSSSALERACRTWTRDIRRSFGRITHSVESTRRAD